MPIIARFVLATDAALFQTLLEEKGIPSTILDADHKAIVVPEEHVEHAQAVYADYSKDNRARADIFEHTHPNKGYPFFGVWALISVAFMLLFAALCLPSMRADTDADTWLFFFGIMFLEGILIGLAIACGIAFLRMIPTAFKRKTGQ